MPLEGCLHGRREWRRLIQGRKESGMVNPLEFCALVGSPGPRSCRPYQRERWGLPQNR